ncbi:MAG: C25 family cysteine peptidase, partial [Candidatus Thermoplasmatota archaeon]|nr:C25 family cysteine peptidase [Candidatus Thermoplasmatota archaeon]
MRKEIVIIIVGLFIGVSVTTVVGIKSGMTKNIKLDNFNNNINHQIKTFNFSKPQIIYERKYARIDTDGFNSFIMNSGEPILPIFNYVIEFPLGTKIVDVKCISLSFDTMYLTKKILTAPTPITIGYLTDLLKNKFNKRLYESSDLYPSEWFNYYTGGGLANGKRVTFLAVHIYPVRYAPKINLINYIKNISMEVSYESLKSSSKLTSEEYDLLIITPEEFLENIQPLVDHKNNHNVLTKLITVEEINGIGRDKQEQIKYYIKDAIEDYG